MFLEMLLKRCLKRHYIYMSLKRRYIQRYYIVSGVNKKVFPNVDKEPSYRRCYKRR
jgi:hypothetical protein